MTEMTLIKTMPLPFGQCWAWYPDANVVALSPDLSPAEREHALCEVQAFWRRSCLRIVTTEDHGVPTEPLAVHATG